MKPILTGIILAVLINSFISPKPVIKAKAYESTRQCKSNKSTPKSITVQANVVEHREEKHEYIIPSIITTPTQPTTPTTRGGRRVGKVSFYTNDYCRQFNPNCRTASGEVFDDSLLTAACSSDYDLGSTLSVTHGDVSVLVRCNDRGSFAGKYGRVLDLSKKAFETLAPLSRGVISVEIEQI